MYALRGLTDEFWHFMFDQPHVVEQLALLPEHDMTGHGRVVFCFGGLEFHEVERDLTSPHGFLIIPTRHDHAGRME